MEGAAIILNYFRNWRVFVVAILVCVCASLIYLYYADPLFEIKATIAVKDENRIPEESATLEKLDQVNSPKIAEKEIEVLKSKSLMDQTIKNLQLWYTFYQEKDFRSQELYLNDHFRLEYFKRRSLLKSAEDEDDVELKLIIKDSMSYAISSDKTQRQTVAFGSLVDIDGATFKLNRVKDVKSLEGVELNLVVSDLDKISKMYQSKFEAYLLSKQAPAISLTIADKIPERGIAALNQLISIYSECSVEEKNKLTESTLKFIDDRLLLLTKELSSTEQAVEGFRSSRGLTDINSESRIYLENVQANDIKLNEVNVKLNVIGEIDKYVNSPLNSQSPPTTLGIDDPALSSQIKQLFELNLQRDRLLATTPETNPIFDGIDRQIETTKASIRNNVRNIRNSLLAIQRKLNAYSTDIESSIKNIPAQERQYVSIKRQQSTKENLYLYLLQKREEVSLSYAATISDIQVIDYAFNSSIKWPNKMLVVGGGLFFSLIAGATFVYYRNYFDTTVRSREDIESRLPVVISGELMYEKLPKDQIVVGLENFALSEQIRTLRANHLHIPKQHKKGSITLITSSVSREGKSFVAVNLASSLSKMGRRTILIDFDLRRPTVGDTFKIANRKGIVEYVTCSDISISDIINTHASGAKLDFIVSGEIPFNPSELLQDEKIGNLLEYLQSEYDEIIFDTPPVQLVADAFLLSKYANTCYYVIRENFSKAANVNYFKSIVQEQKLPNVHVVLNGIRLNRSEIKKYYAYDTSNKKRA